MNRQRPDRTRSKIIQTADGLGKVKQATVGLDNVKQKLFVPDKVEQTAAD